MRRPTGSTVPGTFVNGESLEHGWKAANMSGGESRREKAEKNLVETRGGKNLK